MFLQPDISWFINDIVIDYGYDYKREQMYTHRDYTCCLREKRSREYMAHNDLKNFSVEYAAVHTRDR